VQYAVVRANNILRKYEERVGQLPDFEDALSQDDLSGCLSSEDIWQLALLSSKAGNAVERAIASGEPAHVAKYAFQLAQSFNNFYHEHSVVSEADPSRRSVLLWLTHYVRNQLVSTLHILGIEQPSFM
jgi:arginyl-tRNA synthetase